MTQLPSEFAEALISAGPHPKRSSANQIFAPFVGSWRLQVSRFDTDGRLSRQSVESGTFPGCWKVGPFRTSGSCPRATHATKDRISMIMEPP
jgi:hypothetical protein